MLSVWESKIRLKKKKKRSNEKVKEIIKFLSNDSYTIEGRKMRKERDGNDEVIKILLMEDVNAKEIEDQLYITPFFN